MTDIVDLITDYLSVGGLFNPEAMEHDKVRKMVIQARDEIQSLRDELVVWQSVFPDIAPEAVLPDRAKLEAENAKLRNALRPFANFEPALREWYSLKSKYGFVEVEQDAWPKHKPVIHRTYPADAQTLNYRALHVSDFQAAVAALEQKP
jgi:hypothetical protein